MNVRDFRALGDGMHDDSDAVQNAIDTAGRRGGIVRFPAGRYMISKPIILPRTGPLPTHAVQLAGEGEFATIIEGLPGFPEKRGMIEWAGTTKNTSGNMMMGQQVSNLSLTLPNVAAVRAILDRPVTALATAEQVQNEWMQLTLENIHINAHNNYHDVLIDLVNCRFARWTNVTADPDNGDGKGYDTLLIRTPSKSVGGILSDDSVGLVCMHVSGLVANFMRGGACRTFEGRAYLTTFEDSNDNGGRYAPSIGGVAPPNTTTPIAYHFTDSTLVTIRNISAEPKGSAFLRIDNGTNIQIDNVSAGNPPAYGMIAQDSIALYGCRNVKIRGRMADPRTASYSQFGVASLRMDANCFDCVASDYDVTVVGGPSANQRAADQIRIDPKAVGCKASGVALQVWSPDGKGYREPYAIGNN